MASPAKSIGGGSNARSRLVEAKEQRRRAELDAQLLANRIALLKQEEDKAWKKIEETRKRADEIGKSRSQNYNKFEAKEQMYKEKWERIRDAQAANSYAREKSKATREANQKALVESKRAAVRAARANAEQVLRDKRAKELEDKKKNAERMAYIRQQKEAAKRKMEEERQAKMEAYREEYEQRVNEEELLRSRTEALVAQMEKEELELIQRLQNTQQVQKAAYAELEGAIGGGKAGEQ